MLASVAQISGFKVMVTSARKQNINTLYMAGFGAKKEVADTTGKTITRVADAAAPCEW
jgi:hypothetical protein